MNDELSSITKWFQMNKLTLKVKKCTFVIFCNIKKSYPKEQAKVFSDGSEMMQVKTSSFLGILVDVRRVKSHRPGLQKVHEDDGHIKKSESSNSSFCSFNLIL